MNKFEQSRLLHVLCCVTVACANEICTPQAVAAINRCARPLYEIGAFEEGEREQGISWRFFTQHSKTYFVSVCKAFFDFDSCTERFQENCFDKEPIRNEYRMPTEALNFLCYDGYKDFLKSFNCLSAAFSSRNLIDCQSEMLYDVHMISNSLNKQTEADLVCRVMRDYMSCVKLPIRYTCGYNAWRVVAESVKRPTKIVMPNCSLYGFALSPDSWVVFLVCISTLLRAYQPLQ